MKNQRIETVILTCLVSVFVVENHRTQTQYNDMLIMKLFAFQFVNTYTSLFYIAFFRGVSVSSSSFSILSLSLGSLCGSGCGSQFAKQTSSLLFSAHDRRDH